MPRLVEKPPTQPQWLSLQDAAARYGVAVQTLRRAISRGELTAARLGPRIIRVRIEDLEATFRPIPSVRRPA